MLRVQRTCCFFRWSSVNLHRRQRGRARPLRWPPTNRSLTDDIHRASRTHQGTCGSASPKTKFAPADRARAMFVLVHAGSRVAPDYYSVLYVTMTCFRRGIGGVQPRSSNKPLPSARIRAAQSTGLEKGTVASELKSKPNGRG